MKIQSAEFALVDWQEFDLIDATAPQVKQMSDGFNQSKLIKVDSVVCPKCLIGNLDAKGNCNLSSCASVVKQGIAQNAPSRLFAEFGICATVFALILVILGFLI